MMTNNSLPLNTGSPTASTDLDFIALGGFPIAFTNATELNAYLGERLDHTRQQAIFFANTNFIVKCQPMRNKIVAANSLVINDGVGLDIASALVHGKKFPENLNGSDYLPQLFQALNTRANVFLFGGKPGIAERAANALQTQFNIRIAGCCDGYSQGRNTEKLIATINQSGANIVMVAMGNPLQERWILDNISKTSATLFIGVGAFFDFMAGDKPRAPKWIRQLRMEWFYRMCLEPARLVRRYTLDIAVFLSICLRAGKNYPEATDAR